MPEQKSAKSRNFSLAFEQMCSMVAIAQTNSTYETLKELILQCFVILPSESFQNPHQLLHTIDGLFGLQIAEHEVQFAVNQLIEAEKILVSDDGVYKLPLLIRAQLQRRIDEAKTLEDNVKTNWFAEIAKNQPLLEPQLAWETLKSYLAQAFRRHGIQTVALVDPTIDLDDDHTDNLSTILETVIKDAPKDQQSHVKRAVSDFLAGAGNSADRATYIAQLADGAFNYFSLTIAPDVAQQFRAQLSPLLLFLDTNFLFGILDLTVNSQVAVSNELLDAIREYRLPFRLRYHESTERELNASISLYEEKLRARSWPRYLSRAAVISRNLSGVELKYHQRHAETGIDVDAFFARYHHVDVLLKDKNIDIYRPSANRMNERANILNEYKAFLEARGRDKPYEVIDHDTTLLDAVRQTRSNSKSSIQAGALLITCDYSLYRFDLETSRARGEYTSTVLPNIFWQILRPFMPSSANFDRSFAETFAIPEFRIIGSGASRACSKMIHILAGYEGVSEETAVRLLSNDLLINKLKSTKSDAEFTQTVENAIVSENATLVEENAALERQLANERDAKLLKEKELEQARREQFQEKHNFELVVQRFQAESQEIERAKQLVQVALEQESRELQFTKELAINADRAKSDAEKRALEAEQQLTLFRNLSWAGLISLLSIVGFLVSVYYIPWVWLINHPNSYGLQAAFILLFITIPFGWFVRAWRKILWGFAFGGLVLIIIQMLGGPALPTK